MMMIEKSMQCRTVSDEDWSNVYATCNPAKFNKLIVIVDSYEHIIIYITFIYKINTTYRNLLLGTKEISIRTPVGKISQGFIDSILE